MRCCCSRYLDLECRSWRRDLENEGHRHLREDFREYWSSLERGASCGTKQKPVREANAREGGNYYQTMSMKAWFSLSFVGELTNTAATPSNTSGIVCFRSTSLSHDVSFSHRCCKMLTTSSSTAVDVIRRWFCNGLPLNSPSSVSASSCWKADSRVTLFRIFDIHYKNLNYWFLRFYCPYT